MKVFAVAIFAIFCAASINAVPRPYVQDGELAEKNDHSVIVLALARVEDQRAAFGAGSIISKRHILTAAHLCVGAKQFRIGYGHVKAREVIRLKAQSALIHSDFDAQTLENDLAIITLPQNQLINLQIVRPIAIGKTPVKVTDEGIVASFGFENNESTTISENLLIAHQVVIDNEACAAAFNRPVHVNQFCGQDPKTASPPGPPEGSSEPDDSKPESDDTKKNPDGLSDEPVADNDDDDWVNGGWSRSGLSRVATDEKNQTAICRGDTGSAIVRETDKGTVGFGIVSRVPQGCNVDKPALYTHLPAFYQWLEDATLGEVNIVDF